MEISQFSFILLAVYSFCFGIALGVIYDIVRISRVVLGAEYGNSDKIDYRNIELPIIKKKSYSVKFDKVLQKILAVYVVVSDVLFVTACGAIMVLVAYAYNSGRVRAIMLLGLLAGFLAYYFTVGKLVIRLSRLVDFLLRSALVYLYEIMATPIRLVIRMIKTKDKEERRKNDKRKKKKLGGRAVPQ